MTEKVQKSNLKDSIQFNQLDYCDGIMCRNVCLSCSKNEKILNNVNLNVKEGQIYSLLGPSGCGKTSLLRCVVGIKKHNSGIIKLFKKKQDDKFLQIPGLNIGYMPQELALYNDLTIFEMLYYMSKIFQLKTDQANQRINELIDLLNLPVANSYIKNLSGGQQRRVSFAATILHYPKLVILDEPTAGVDPILREKIWLTLIEMKQNFNITIIITTHYIEESRRAEKIGFMRKGEILCEDNPNSLMKKFNSITLEGVFLKICIQIKSCTNNQECKNTIELEDKNNSLLNISIAHSKTNLKSKNLLQQKTCFIKHKLTDENQDLTKLRFKLFFAWLNILFALIKKNLYQDFRDPLKLSFQYFSPFAQVLLFALCIGRNPIGIELGVYTNEFSFLNFSSKYLNVIDKECVHLIYYTNFSQALEDVKKRKLWGVISFNTYYSHAFMERFAYNVSNIAIENSTIIINSDITNKIITDLTFKQLTKYYRKFVKNEFDRYHIDSKYALSYIEYNETIYGKINDERYTGFLNFMLPGIIINLTFAMAIAITSITLINEQNCQTIERNYASGITSNQIIISHVIGRIILSLPYAFLVLLLPITIFKLPQNGNLLIATSIVLFQNIFGITCGLIVACLSKSLIMSMVATSGSFMITLFLSGTLWPIEAIPIKLRFLAYSLPTTLATEALRSIVLRGWSIENYYIWISFCLTLIYIIIASLIGLKLFKINE